jgi:hypothetical protein
MAKASQQRMWTTTNLPVLPAAPTNIKEDGGELALYLTKGWFLYIYLFLFGEELRQIIHIFSD